jgi:hypothetical protein
LLGFSKQRKNLPKQEIFDFLETTVHRVVEKQKTNKIQGRNPRFQKSKCFGWISATKKDCAYTLWSEATNAVTIN